MKNRKIVELPKETIKKNLGKCLKSEKKGNSKGITLVSLIITIIVLIILAGISINLTIGNEGIFTIAKRAKENMELAQIEEQEKLNTLYTELDFNTEGEGVTGGSGSYDAIQELIKFKRAIIDAIKDADGVETSIEAETETFQSNIKEIVAKVTKDATATPEDISQGKTAWVNGNKLVGTNSNDGFAKVIYNKEVTQNNAVGKKGSATLTCELEAGNYYVYIYYISNHTISGVKMTLNDEDITPLSSKISTNIVCAFANIKTNDLSTIELTGATNSNNTTSYITIQLIVVRG